ncbi:MAG: diacylglycerol kinase [Gammaproteobacteria bacterium]|nr:diacylglycerol kinase [Gammaproteobacteria bacterium]
MKTLHPRRYLAGLIWFGCVTPMIAVAAHTSNQDARTLYKEECASCHMAYPAELLPARSWQAILGKLDKHFGDNASLDSATQQRLLQYLQANSADAAATRLAQRQQRSIPAATTPLRISETAYIRRKHDEIPARLITANPQVKSLSNCIACHQGAERGVFNEHQVRIPGYGQWDD